MKPLTTRWVIAAALLGTFLTAGRGSPSAQGGEEARQDELNRVNRAFLIALREGVTSEMRPYFPRTGVLTYVQTIHGSDGDRVGIWRFSAQDVVRQLNLRGPIRDSVRLSPESQTPGVLMDQAMCRGTAWRVASPDGRVDAVLVRVNSGATTSVGWNLFLVSAGEKAPRKDALFIAEHVGESDLSIEWTAPRVLEIRLPDSRILHFRNFWSSPQVDALRYVVRVRLVESPRPVPADGP